MSGADVNSFFKVDGELDNSSEDEENNGVNRD